MSENDKNQFFNPKAKYMGEFSPTNLAFNANLQEFANRVSIICALETGGKILPIDAYRQINDLWTKLVRAKQNLLDEN